MKALSILKYLFLAISTFHIIIFTANAGKQRTSVCLISKKNGQAKRKNCKVFDHNKANNKVKGVCIFDGKWKRGNWNNKPKKKKPVTGKARFTLKDVCDLGVEVLTLPDDTQTSGGAKAITVNGKKSTSTITETEKLKVPSTCYKKISKNIPSGPLDCEQSSENAKGFCYVVNNPHKNYQGDWWVRSKKAAKQKNGVFKKSSAAICKGGVVFEIEDTESSEESTEESNEETTE